MRTPADDDIAQRLLALEEHARAPGSTTHRPDVVAVERVFSQHNVRTVMGTAQAAAVAITAAARAGVPVVLHTPSEVKAAITGSGRADKAQVGHMVARLLGAGRAAEARRHRRRARAGDLPRLAGRSDGSKLEQAQAGGSVAGAR